MNILIVCQYFWPESFRVNDVAASLRDRGHQVTVLTGKPNYPDGPFFPGYRFSGICRETYHGVNVVRVPIFPRGQNSRLRLTLNFASFAISGSLLAPFVTTGEYDGILVYALSPIIQALPAFVLKMLGRGPVHIWLQDLWPESLSATGAVRAKWLIRAVGFVTALIHRGADQNLVSCAGFTERLQAMGAAPERIRYLPNYAEDFYGKQANVDKSAECEALVPQGFRVMFAGNIGEAQDFSTILAAAELLKEQKHIHWVIVGDGREFFWVRKETKRRGLEETFHLAGRYPVEQMPQWFACADVMLVTLRTDPIFALTLPTKVHSYMAASKPLIAALDGEAARIVNESKCCLCVRTGDSAALAEAVLKASRMSAQKLQRLGRNGREYFDEHFDRQRVIFQLEEWMQSVAKASVRK
jgi:glycosyltransferase involved in cell wall biosynthesis